MKRPTFKSSCIILATKNSLCLNQKI